MASNRFKIKQEWQEGGYRVVIDEHLDENSSNPVANWVLKQAIEQGGGGGGGTWGTITGTITDQTDLIQYINAHGAGTWGAITGTLTNQTDLVQYINNALANYYTKSQVYTKTETDALIPTVNDKTLTIQKNGSDVGTFTANSAQDKTINITVPTTAADVDALPDTTKYAASLTLSLNSTTYEMTATLKDQDGNTLGTAQTIDLPIESVVVSGRYDSTTKEVVLVLQSGSEIKFSVADLISGLQTEITSTNKLNADLVDDSTSTHKFTTASDISKLAGIEANANKYVLPKATTTTLGGVKVGEHLEIDSNGVLETDEHVALYSEPDDPQPIPPITTDRIADGAVTTPKIADDAVTEAKIANGAVTADKLNKTSIINIIYPVGSIYMSVNNVSPQSFLGGTWQAFGAGRTLVGVDTSQTEFDTVEETGGEKTHTLTSSEIPAHNHPLNKPSNTDATAYHSTVGTNHWFAVRGSGSTQYPDAFQYANPTVGNNTGGGGAHNNLQPYITVYMWKRTA